MTVFAPDDLVLVKGSPSARREYLDDLLVAVTPRYAATRAEYERVLKHRNALLKGGVRDEEARATLDVFDNQLVSAGSDLVSGRLRLAHQLAPIVERAYRSLAGSDDVIGAEYAAEWAGDGPLEADGSPRAHARGPGRSPTPGARSPAHPRRPAPRRLATRGRIVSAAERTRPRGSSARSPWRCASRATNS